MAAEETYIEHPNRDKAESKATKAIVCLLMVTTAVLMILVTAGGWLVLQGAQPFAVLYILLYLLMAFYVVRWNRGVLPVASGMSILLAVLAAVAAPGWFERDKSGYLEGALPSSLLGLLTIVLIPVSVLVVVFAMRGFSQKWNVEVERRRGHDDHDDQEGYDDYQGAEPAGA